MHTPHDAISRRVVIAGLASSAAMAGTAFAQPSTNGAKPMTSILKIDTHQHFLPQVYVDAVGLDTLAGVMPNKKAPESSAERAIAMMDAHGIGEGIISVSSGPPIPDAANLLRKCNDVAAKLMAQYPGRFGSFASLPLPDVDASLREVEYSLDVLKADGVIVFTNYSGKYLGDPHFSPLWDELNRRSATVFIHPNQPPYDIPGLPPASVLEFPFDTTRAAASLIMAGAMRTWPNIRFILSHAGGTLPYLAQRLAGGVMMNPAAAERVGDPAAAIRAFYFDTALSMSPSAMAALLTVADPTKILFGTDFPMAPEFAIAASTAGLGKLPMPEGLRADIARGNAARLLKRAS